MFAGRRKVRKNIGKSVKKRNMCLEKTGNQEKSGKEPGKEMSGQKTQKKVKRCGKKQESKGDV